MGIYLLSKYIDSNCKRSITKNVHLSILEGKIIVIDISILLYKFKQKNSLIESIYLMCSIFRKYNIVPIMVFDGKPTSDKDYYLQLKKTQKIKDFNTYKELLEKYKRNNNKDIRKQLNILNTKLISITKQDIIYVKELLTIMGIQYIQSKQESDSVCANLVNQDIAWGCLSNDSDMFVYNCKYIIKHLNLYRQTVSIYNTSSILQQLSISSANFKILCLLSKNDYNYDSYYTIYNMFEYFKLFKLSRERNFKKWILNIINSNKHSINNILKIYNNIEKIPQGIKYKNNNIDRESLKRYLSYHRFIFI